MALEDELHRLRFGGHNDDRRADDIYHKMIEAEQQGDAPEMAIQARLKLLRELTREQRGDLIDGPMRETLKIGEEMLKAIQGNDAEEGASLGYAFGAAWTQLKYKVR